MTKEKAHKILCRKIMPCLVGEWREAISIAAKALEAEPHWIPVTERLPETSDAVLTTYIVNGDRSRRYVEESSYYGNDESWSSPWDEYRIAGTRIEVIAWMPLPEAWRGDGMSEAIAFIAGLVAMAVVWFINDNSPDTSPYAHGYVEGYKDAMKEYKKKEVTE